MYSVFLFFDFASHSFYSPIPVLCSRQDPGEFSCNSQSWLLFKCPLWSTIRLSKPPPKNFVCCGSFDRQLPSLWAHLTYSTKPRLASDSWSQLYVFVVCTARHLLTFHQGFALCSLSSEQEQTRTDLPNLVLLPSNPSVDPLSADGPSVSLPRNCGIRYLLPSDVLIASEILQTFEMITWHPFTLDLSLFYPLDCKVNSKSLRLSCPKCSEIKKLN